MIPSLREDVLGRLEPMITTAPSKEAQAGAAYGLAKYGIIRLCQREAAAWGAGRWRGDSRDALNAFPAE
jgi:hypothetical protein